MELGALALSNAPSASFRVAQPSLGWNVLGAGRRDDNLLVTMEFIFGASTEFISNLLIRGAIFIGATIVEGLFDWVHSPILLLSGFVRLGHYNFYL